MLHRLRRIALPAGLALISLGLFQAPVRAEKSIEISLRDRYLTLFDNGQVVKRFPVAIGAPESPTPAGTYAITRMEEAPVYHKGGKVIAPGPENPVGVRYMRAAVSLGCIRMLTQDVIALFQQVDVGTPVIVTTK